MQSVCLLASIVSAVLAYQGVCMCKNRGYSVLCLDYES
jgi:hypothetical protein